MLEIGLLSLEGGGALNPLSLPLSTRGWRERGVDAEGGADKVSAEASPVE